MQSEQVHHERLKMGDRIKTYVIEVKRTTKGPQIMVSRTHPGLLKRLLELEVPEIHDGVVEIKAIAREPGSRSKVAVHSRDLNVDPVGACVGQKGARIQAIVSELKGEKIDIVRWDSDPAVFVGNALSPALFCGARSARFNSLSIHIRSATSLNSGIKPCGCGSSHSLWNSAIQSWIWR